MSPKVTHVEELRPRVGTDEPRWLLRYRLARGSGQGRGSAPRTAWVWQLRAGPTLPTAAPSWGDANETQVRAALPAWPFLAALRTSRTAAVPGDATGCVGALRGLLGLWEQRADT